TGSAALGNPGNALRSADINGPPRTTHDGRRTALWQPAAGKSCPLQTANDVRVGAHHAPHEIGPEVLHHRQNRSLIDAEVVDVEPAERRVHGPGLLLAGGREGGIEGVEEAVGREKMA